LVKKKITFNLIINRIGHDLDQLLNLQKPPQVTSFYANQFNVDRSQLPSVDELIEEIRKQALKRIGLNLRKKNVTNELSLSLLYHEKIEDLESSSQILKLNSSGKNEYEKLIRADIDKAKVAANIKESMQSGKSQEKQTPQERMVDWVVDTTIEEKASVIEKGVKEKEKEFDRQLEAKEKDIMNISTVLKTVSDDDLVYEDEDISMTSTEWWNEIGLRDDPFNINGLENIDVKDYDDILVDNAGIKFAKEFRKDKGAFNLGKNNLLLGELGTGKSCVIQYISNYSLNREIISFTIRIATGFSVEGLHISLYSSLARQIMRWLDKHGSRDPLEPTQEGCIIGLLSIKDMRPKNYGFIIFVEDLHKISNVDIVFDFLQMFQPLQESIKDEGINISFIVSGVPSWKEKVIANPYLTSVFSTTDIIEIEDVTSEIATKAIMNRFNVYRSDRDVKLISRDRFTLAPKYIKNLTNLIKKQNVHTGFRLYFSEVKKNLISRRYDMFQVSPAGLTNDMRDKYVVLLNKEKDLKRLLDKLTNIRLKNSKVKIEKQREAKIRLLAHLVQHQGISEQDNLLLSKNNTVIVDHLFRFCKIITMEPATEKWIPVMTLLKFHEALLDEFDVGLDYFLVNYHIPTYATTKYKDTEVAFEKQHKILIEQINALLCVNDEDSILATEFDAISGKIFDEVIKPRYVKAQGYKTISVDKIKKIISNLVEFLIKIESPPLSDAFPERIRAWDYRWNKQLENVTRFKKEYMRKDTSDITKQEFLIDSMETVDELLEELKKILSMLRQVNKEFLQIGKQQTIKVIDLHPDILSDLFKEEKKISNTSFDNLAISYQDYLRLYFKVATTLSYGKYDNRRKIWSKVASGGALDRMINSSDLQRARSIDPDEFEQLQRAEFKQFINCTHKLSYYYEVSKPLIARFPDKNSLIQSIDKFKPLNIATSHQKYDEKQYLIDSYISQYSSMLSQIKIISLLISDIILDKYVILEPRDNRANPEVVFSQILSSKYSRDISEHVLSEKEHDNFIADVEKYELYRWIAEDKSDVFFSASKTTLIDFKEYGGFGQLYGNYYFGQAASNFVYTIKQNRLKIKQIYGCQFLLQKE